MPHLVIKAFDKNYNLIPFAIEDGDFTVTIPEDSVLKRVQVFPETMILSHWKNHTAEQTEIKLEEITHIYVVNKVLRRNDGYIRKFIKQVNVQARGELYFGIPQETFQRLKVYARAQKFAVSTEKIIERKLTSKGMAFRSAFNWTWSRQ